MRQSINELLRGPEKMGVNFVRPIEICNSATKPVFFKAIISGQVVVIEDQELLFGYTE